MLLTNIRSRWLDIGQALFCEANTQLSSPNKLDWFAHLSSQSENRICFILPAQGFNHKIVINTGMLYWPGVRLRWLDGCALRKIDGSPVPWTCQIHCAQKMKDFLVAREQKLGTTAHRAQPCLGQWKCKNEWSQYSAILNDQAWSINDLLHGQEENF